MDETARKLKNFGTSSLCKGKSDIKNLADLKLKNHMTFQHITNMWVVNESSLVISRRLRNID